jgi:alpha-N-acetylglucosaminidase
MQKINLKTSNLQLSVFILLLFFFTGTTSSRADGNKLRVLTYNIHHCNPPSKPGFIDLDAIAKVINENNPDIVLQEVDILTSRSGNIDELKNLAERTDLNFYFGKAIDYDGGKYGVGILSKYPVSESKTFALPNPYNAEPLALAISKISLPEGQQIYFASTHLDVSKAGNRDAQATEIIKLASELELPFFLAGDFNAQPDSKSIQILEEHFDRSCQKCDFTIPSDNPKRTIDHIFLSKGAPLSVKSTKVINEPYPSDHLPVLAVYEWKNKATSKLDAENMFRTARGVIERTTGTPLKNIIMKELPVEKTTDAYEIEASNGTLTLRGNSPVAICYGFYTYMKDACHSMVSWSGKQLNLPKQWPDSPLKKGQSPYLYRYYLNVVTFGYTTPYWDWKRWDKELDWMALHGINMPLALVASEAIAERVWLKMGLSKDEIRSFFTGPAYLPWHRMGNLNRWDGPLTENWQKEQIELQHKIIKRMRELGMHPIAPAFAGFVPPAFQKKYPDAKVSELKWGGFAKEDNACVLAPNSTFFKKIGKLFIEEWEKEFGKNEFYLSDSFNEMDVPVSNDKPEEKYKLLADYGKAIYESISAGNPDAVWVTQGWTFGYQHKFWDKSSLKALLSQVPDDKMLILDLGNEYPEYVWKIDPVWKTHEGFYGKKWIYSFVPNFGGKNQYTGIASLYASGPVDALESPCKKNMVGFGFAPEGIENNEFIYELLADMGWQSSRINLNDYAAKYTEARYGASPGKMKSAYRHLFQSCYNNFSPYPRFLWQLVTPDTRRRGKVNNDPAFFQAAEEFLACKQELKSSELYKNDAIEISAFYLGLIAEEYYKKALIFFDEGNQKEAQKEGAKTISILKEVDRLLASHPNYRLINWVEMSRQHGISEEEKNHYEADAKRLITTWGGRQEDYASRVWSGLISSYYIPRIQLYLEGKGDSLPEWEEHWVTTSAPYKVVPFKDPLRHAKTLVIKYKKATKNIMGEER